MPGVAMNAIDAVFGRLYAIPVPDRPRTRPLQVICIGPSRSGTDSLKEALLQLGYPKVYHGYETLLPTTRHHKPTLCKLLDKKYHSGSKDGNIVFTAEEFDQVFGEYDALTDMPAASFASELAIAYPNAKIILNRRKDVDAWYKSFEGTFQANKKEWWSYICSWFSPDLYWSKRIVHRNIMPNFFRKDFQANGKWVYREHCAMGRGIVPKERFLEWGVEDGWEPLCEFLEKPVPKGPFPNGNAPSAFLKIIGENHGRWVRDAYWNMALVSGSLIAMVTLLMFRKQVGKVALGVWAYANDAVRSMASRNG